MNSTSSVSASVRSGREGSGKFGNVGHSGGVTGLCTGVVMKEKTNLTNRLLCYRRPIS